MESCNKNIQNDEFKAISKKYSEVKMNNKAIHQNIPQNKDQRALNVKNVFTFSLPDDERGKVHDIFSSIRPGFAGQTRR